MTADPSLAVNPQRAVEYTLNAHFSDDLDQAPNSHHHSVGYGPNQAAPGDRTNKRLTALETASPSTITFNALSPGPKVANLNTLTSGTTYYDAGYRLLQLLTIQLRGILQNNGGALATTDTIFTLPVGARPVRTAIFTCGYYNSTTAVFTAIPLIAASSGVVTSPSAVPVNSVFYLDGVQFYLGSD